MHLPVTTCSSHGSNQTAWPLRFVPPAMSRDDARKHALLLDLLQRVDSSIDVMIGR